jgi:hypothetical protein
MVAVSQRFFTYEERPELRGRAGFLRAAWPAFMLESPISNERWHLLYERFGRHQFWLVDESSDEILAKGTRCRSASTSPTCRTGAGST